MTVRALLAKFDAIPERVLLWVNVGLAAFVGVAHGGALAITYMKPTPQADQIRQLASISLPIAALIVVTAVVALVQPTYRRPTLAIHGAAFALSSLALLVWALSLLVHGLPEGNFAWSPGLMSIWICYSAFVASRYSVSPAMRHRSLLFYAPLVAIFVAIPIDVAVFIEFMGEISKRFG